MENRKLRPPNGFDDLAECYEYYQDMLGTFSEAEEHYKTRKQRKRMFNFIYDAFYLDCKIWYARKKVEIGVDKVELKEFKKDFNEEHGIRNMWQRIQYGSKKCLQLLIPHKRNNPTKADMQILPSNDPLTALNDVQTEIEDVNMKEHSESEVQRENSQK